MNPYAATFQSPIPATTPAGAEATAASEAGNLGHPADDSATAAAAAAAEYGGTGSGDIGPTTDHEGGSESWDADGGGGGSGGITYWDTHGQQQHAPGFASTAAAGGLGYGEYSDGTGAGYHPAGSYEAAAYHQHHQNGTVLVAAGPQNGAGDGWNELRRVYEDRAAVTAVEFDPLEELLWAGHSDGRLTAYVQPDMTRHSSVAAHRHHGMSGGRPRDTSKAVDGGILGLSVFDKGVISLSTSAVRLHSRGGLLRGTLQGLVEAPGRRGIPPTTHFIENLSCGTLNTPSAMMGVGADSASHMIVGTMGRGVGAGTTEADAAPHLLQLDPLSDLRLMRAVGLPKEAGVMAMERGAMLAVGGQDGHIRLFDPRLRSSTPEHTLKAHTGPIQAMAITPTDGLKIVSVGMTAKSLNPYDTSAPTELFNDPVVRVFDVRMPGRPGPPLQFSMLGAPRLVHFLADESLALATSSGQFLLSKEPFTETPSMEFFHVTDEQGNGEALTCMAMASSGDGIAVGSASGACIQMGHGEKDVRSNITSRSVQGAEKAEQSAKVYVHPLDEAPPASKCVVRQTAKAAHVTGPLSSSFASTPKFLRAVLRRPPPRRPATALLEKAVWRDYLGVIPNPGYEPNSLLFGKGKAAYEVVDPRRRKDKDTPVFDRRNRNGSLGTSAADLQARGLEDVPRRYRRPVLNLGRRGFDGFDFARYNSTEYAGLENAHAHAYVNSVLQMLFFVPEVKEAALREQYNPIHYTPLSGRATSGLSCELGFLFWQLGRAGEMDRKNRSCQATNFLRAFKEAPEVVALGLLEDPQDKRAIGLPRRIEALHRFLLSQLDKEAKEPVLPPAPAPTPPAKASNNNNRKKDPKMKASGKQKGKAAAAAAAAAAEAQAAAEASAAQEAADKEAAAAAAAAATATGAKPRSTVDRLYGYGTRTSNAFLHNKRTTIDVKHTRTLVTEMIPVDHPGHSAPAKYFADVLARSLCRETRARAWCNETSGYAPIKQKRCPVSLPDVMPIHCAAALESSEATRATIGGKNCRGGAWLPREISISLVEREDGELTVVVGEAADPAAKWMQDLEAEDKKVAEEAEGEQAISAATERKGATAAAEVSAAPATTPSGREHEGWYFTSPLPGKSGASAVAAAMAGAVGEGTGTKAGAKVAPAAKGKAATAGRDEEDGENSPRWLQEGITQHRYKLMSVISRVVPIVKENKAVGGAADGGEGIGAAAAAAAAVASGEGETTADEGHLVFHVKAPDVVAKALVTPPKSNTRPSKAKNSRGEGGVGTVNVRDMETRGREAASVAAESKRVDRDGFSSSSGSASPSDSAVSIPAKGNQAKTPAVHPPTKKDATEDRTPAASKSSPATPASTAVPASGRREGGDTREQQDGKDQELKKPEEEGVEDEEEEAWLIFNDFLVERTVLDDARGFGPKWKEPCLLVYRRVESTSPSVNDATGKAAAASAAAAAAARRAMLARLAIPASVFDISSLAKNRPVSQVVRLPPDRLPGKGDIIAIDAEFVSLMVEESRLRGDGSKVVTKQGRQSLARVSVLDGRHSGSENNAVVIMDDYVVQSEPVVDHLTRFSGITPEDLDPGASRHHLHHLRTVYLRLRWLADAGCVFLGHGLANDFRMFNLALPPDQVIDTVNLWSLPGQRKISLRFLAHYLLDMNIQGETHDSIEDARIALALYNKYRSHVKAATLSTALDALYKYGWEVSWKLDGGIAA